MLIYSLQYDYPLRALPCALSYFCLWFSRAPCLWFLLRGRLGVTFIERGISLLVHFANLNTFDFSNNHHGFSYQPALPVYSQEQVIPLSSV
jgi:hypothetical protein